MIEIMHIDKSGKNDPVNKENGKKQSNQADKFTAVFLSNIFK